MFKGVSMYMCICIYLYKNMAAALVRSYTQFSSLRQSLIDVIRRDLAVNNFFQTFAVTCIQCQCYHVTPMYLKQRKSRQEKKEERAKKLGCVKPAAIPIIKKDLPVVKVWKNMTVQELAQSAQRELNEVLDAISLLDKETRYTENSVVTNPFIVNKAVTTLGAKVMITTRPDDVKEVVGKNHDVVRRPPPDESVLRKRHPVVTVMGHVDHGKTTLLDALRNTSVVQSEFGGITQHIGAFNVTLKSGARVTFLDTPGHAAFSAMRARGAHATDIVVLVVAADDGVMDQTVQSIEMAKNANVPIIVAINKIDKPTADIKRTQTMLAQQGIVVEDLGGDVQCVKVSALKGTNLETLTEAIALQAEIMDLKGDPTGFVEGVLIESANHSGRGKLATALIQRGTLRKGSVIVAGLSWAKVRGMFDHAGTPVLQARPSEAVQIIGWRSLPSVGDEILEVESEHRARMVLKFREAQSATVLAEQHKDAADKKHEEYLIEYRKHLEYRRSISKYIKLQQRVVEKADPYANVPKISLIIKGDVSGSVEAILDVLDTYTENDLCRLIVTHYGVGPITENDLELAETFNAMIYRFNVDVPPKLKEEAEKKGITIRSHKVIYKLVDDIKETINSILPTVEKEEIIGEANVLQEFEITDGKKKVRVAGCRCVKGVLKKSALYHLVRDNETIYTGRLVAMRHLKEEVTTVKINVECGLRFDDPKIVFKPGDVLLCFTKYRVPQETSWDPGF